MDVSGTAMAGDTKGTSYRKELTPGSEPLARGHDARAAVAERIRVPSLEGGG